MPDPTRIELIVPMYASLKAFDRDGTTNVQLGHLVITVDAAPELHVDDEALQLAGRVLRPNAG